MEGENYKVVKLEENKWGIQGRGRTRTQAVLAVDSGYHCLKNTLETDMLMLVGIDECKDFDTDEYVCEAYHKEAM